MNRTSTFMVLMCLIFTGCKYSKSVLMPPRITPSIQINQKSTMLIAAARVPHGSSINAVTLQRLSFPVHAQMIKHGLDAFACTLPIPINWIESLSK